MRPDYETAIDTRLAWLTWAESKGQNAWDDMGYGKAMAFYRDCLQRADLYVMTAPFCQLVDHARRTAPDDLAFDLEWLVTPHGFLWLAEPFLCPELDPEAEPNIANEVKLFNEHGIKVQAVGWRVLPAGQRVTNAQTGVKEIVGPGGAVHVATYQAFTQYRWATDAEGFGCWSYLTIYPGHRLGDRVAHFENKQTSGRYVEGFGPARSVGARFPRDRRQHALHEIRWIYTAFHLMAQRLAVTPEVRPNRATRRRMEHEHRLATPTVKVVTLRRLTEKRERVGPARHVDWSCRWEVSGHWRHYETGNVTWIDTFEKGPTDKPFRKPITKLFSAQR